ncbi:MAG: hypothetical protein JNK35_09440 [Phycisphaerae bacterium]|nr:hypothetical protein [Phycisphaerae bacterium]
MSTKTLRKVRPSANGRHAADAAIRAAGKPAGRAKPDAFDAEVARFHWEPQPEGQKIVGELVHDFLNACPMAAELCEKMKSHTGTRFVDWVDHIQTPKNEAIAGRLKAAGFTHEPMPGAEGHWVHRGAMFPAIILVSGSTTRVAVKVESVPDFLAAWKVPVDQRIEGLPHSQIRRACAFTGKNAELWVIERHGYRGFDVPKADPAACLRSVEHLERFRRRKRDFERDEDGFNHAADLIDAAVADLGVDWTCDLFFASEREYWQRKNRAGQVQKARQDKLGLGWANHDHHTYRSSRQNFKHLMRCLFKLGFTCRERFYAGAEAGWGAQVVEQPVAGITIFADVDMSAEELRGNFAREGLPERKSLGTVGLWCGLHGEAFLQAGMHHLECQFDWHLLKAQLQAEAHVKTMDPFTTFPYLRQAFTEGEKWSVDPRRIFMLLEKGQITARQAEQFHRHGALGSHLENLERNDGYKGFNQQGVSDIISKTDPRLHAFDKTGA